MASVKSLPRADKPDLTLKLAKLEVKGLVEIELIEPYREPLETPLHRIGSYHLGLSVKNVAEAYERLKDSVVFIQELLNRGVYFGMHPRAYLMELIQRKEPPFQLGNWCP